MRRGRRRVGLVGTDEKIPGRARRDAGLLHSAGNSWNVGVDMVARYRVSYKAYERRRIPGCPLGFFWRGVREMPLTILRYLGVGLRLEHQCCTTSLRHDSRSPAAPRTCLPAGQLQFYTTSQPDCLDMLLSHAFGLTGGGRDISLRQSLLRDMTHSYRLPHINSRGHPVIPHSQPNPFP
jgi:hypothetical protein